MSTVPPGWYQNKDGKMQWWDGTQWGPIAPTEAEKINQSSASEHMKHFGSQNLPRDISADSANSIESLQKFYNVKPKHMSGWRKILIGVIVVAVLWGVLIALQQFEERPSTARQHPRENSTSDNTPLPAPQKSYAEIHDEFAIESGLKVFRSGEIYIDSNVGGPCSYLPCVNYGIISTSACREGLYVRANILSDGIPIGWTSEISASAEAHQPIIVRLEDHLGGDGVLITEISCIG